MICPTCGANIRDGIKFCSACGAALPLNTPSNQQNTEQQRWQEYAQPSAEPQQRRQEYPQQYPQQSAEPQQRQEYAQQSAPAQNAYPSMAPMNMIMDASQLPPQYKPLSAWAYFGYSILYSIPLIGFIILIVNALSDSNINRRNHARSFFCGLIIALILGVIGVILTLILGVSLDELFRYGF